MKHLIQKEYEVKMPCYIVSPEINAHKICTTFQKVKCYSTQKVFDSKIEVSFYTTLFQIKFELCVTASGKYID